MKKMEAINDMHPDITLMQDVIYRIQALLWLCVSSPVLYVSMELIKLDEILLRLLLSFHENLYYGKLYETRNSSIPQNVYSLNFRYDNIYECNICLNPFCKILHGNEVIVKCGHRYHKDCLRSWELKQFHDNVYGLYKCPTCRSEYNWKSKWNYIYTLSMKPHNKVTTKPLSKHKRGRQRKITEFFITNQE